MHVRVIPFGVLKDWLGAAATTVELPAGATVAELLELLERLNAGRDGKGAAERLRGIAVGVNAEYADATRVLADGDEVGLLPPVSGGSAARTDASRKGASRAGASRTANPLDEGCAAHTVGPLEERGRESDDNVALTREPIDSPRLVAEIKRGEDGAVTVFDGIVRNHSRGRQTLYLDYESYEALALKQMEELAAQARVRYGVRQVTLIHRLGRLEIGETSVLIVVASAHRAAAFDACRWLIDTLKQTVPIWKKEIFVDGAVWAPGEPFPAELAVVPAAETETGTPEAPHPEAPHEGARHDA